MLLEFILLTLLYNLMTRYLLKKTQHGITFLMLYLIVALSSCKDDNIASGYDPSSPVEITRIDPEEGGVGTQCLIYGKNFGTDVSQIEVTVNGKKARIVGSDGNCVYCFVPLRAGSGPIKVRVGNEESAQEAVSEKEFKYSYALRVSTLCGYTDKNGKSEIKDGVLSEAGFEVPYWMEIDQKTGDLYLLEEKKAIRRISMAKDTVETIFKITESMNQPRSLSFSTDFDTLFVSNDQGSDTGISTAIALRSTGFKKFTQLISGYSCCGASCHPKRAGEYYYTQWQQGSVFKWDGTTNTSKELFQIVGQLNGTLQFAPSGKFAYIADRDHHVIYKAIYDEQKHELQKANPFCGSRDQDGFVDDIGASARFRNPTQGCFDENDNFYICDQGNYCIRKISPNGTVTTFAGRPGDWGYADGDLRKEAQFNRPHGIAYDPATETFYVADKNNLRIRTILKE